MDQPTFLDALKGTFGVKKEEAKPVVQPIETTTDAKKYRTRNSIERTLGDPTSSAAAQAIFNPNQNVAPSMNSQPKAPAPNMVNKGTLTQDKAEGWGQVK